MCVTRHNASFRGIFGLTFGRLDTHLNGFSFTTHALAVLGFFLCVNLRNVEKKEEIIRAQPLSERGERQSVRGIFCLADFHLQSGDVTFVCGNEIPRQQTLGYIIPLLGFFFISFISGFSLTLFISPWDIKKKEKACLPGSISHVQGLVERGKDARGQKTQPCPRCGEAMKCHGLPTRPLTWQAEVVWGRWSWQ